MLERTRAQLREARDALHEGGEQEPRLQMFFASLDSLHDRLDQTLGRILEETPDEKLEERAQYTVALAGPSDAKAVIGPEEAAAGALSVSRGLRRVFETMAETTARPASSEIYRNLCELLEGYERRIALLEETQRDL